MTGLQNLLVPLKAKFAKHPVSSSPALALSGPDQVAMVQLQQCRAALKQMFPGQERVIDLALCGLISGQHILIEGPPGQGKTALIKSLLRVVIGQEEVTLGRIQGAQDLLPSDLTGHLVPSVAQDLSKEWILRPGPLFCDFLLVDEINRLSARTQSALLQAMEERAISIERRTYPLADHFTLFATQNPQESVGVVPLTESQLDRFALKLQLATYHSEQLKVMLNLKQQKFLPASPLSLEQLKLLRKLEGEIHFSEELTEWIIFFYQSSQPQQASGIGLEGVYPLSLRFLRQLQHLCRAWALLHQHSAVAPGDVMELVVDSAAHRLYQGQRYSLGQAQEKFKQWLQQLT